MHNAVLGGEHSLKASAGGAFGQRYNNQPNPFLSTNGYQNHNPFSQSTPDIFSRPTHSQMADQYDYIMNDPRKTNDEIKTLLENIRPDAELPIEDREGTPDGLVYPLVCERARIINLY